MYVVGCFQIHPNEIRFYWGHLRVYLYSGRKVLFVGGDGFTDQLCGGERLAAAQLGLKRSTRRSQPRFMYVLKPAAD